jgi:hypothetical protein
MHLFAILISFHVPHFKCRYNQINPPKTQTPVIINHRIRYLLSNLYRSLNFSTLFNRICNFSIRELIPSMTFSTVCIFSVKPSAEEYAYRSFMEVSWISRVLALKTEMRCINSFDSDWMEVKAVRLLERVEETVGRLVSIWSIDSWD